MGSKDTRRANSKGGGEGTFKKEARKTRGE